MPLNLGSYLLGVGTVVGALAFGFGGGVLLTHTAMKESPAGQSRVERLARAEPDTAAAAQTPAAPIAPTPGQAAVAPNNEVASPDQDRRSSVAVVKQDAAPEQPAAAPPDSVPVVHAGTAKSEVARESQQVNQAVREPPPKQIDPSERAEAKPVESKETDRKAEHSRRYAERRPPDNPAPRMRQRRLIVQEQPAPEVVVSPPPEQPHLDLFGGLFGRPADAND